MYDRPWELNINPDGKLQRAAGLICVSKGREEIITMHEYYCQGLVLAVILYTRGPLG